MAKTIVEVLKEAQALIRNPKRWTRGRNAADSMGYATDPAGKYAVCWCAQGAIFKVLGVGYRGEGGKTKADLARRALNRLSRTNDGKAVAQINDVGPHEAVLKAFTRAIEE